MNRRFQFTAVVLAFATGVLPLLRLAGTDRAQAESIDALWCDSAGQDSAPAKTWSGDTRGADVGGFVHAHGPNVPPEAFSPDFASGHPQFGHAGLRPTSGPLFLRLRRLRI